VVEDVKMVSSKNKLVAQEQQQASRAAVDLKVEAVNSVG
jgi:hypothetical protein